jgi:hypothetical protein
MALRGSVIVIACICDGTVHGWMGGWRTAAATVTASTTACAHNVLLVVLSILYQQSLTNNKGTLY